ncbi:C2H2-type domain-containing protein [Mycena indigotica]|uniref:C2H2-type domain-containing protein n=1 Tax=Mycena indigotica TaxID=2126181 RepID=A0A8H6WEY9_9AGAR|nr:C2H2-type domain-containing protein [Mycena indigotica]KAF7309969.1 C2H2-type domain-containing protein [Mycena indigotica]
MSIFGQPAQQQQPAGGSLFGSTSQPAAGSSSLFGNTATQPTAPATGLFGQPAASNTTGGGLFGNNTAAATNNTGGGGLFGSTTTVPATTGLFGGGASTTTTPSTGLFGQPQQQQTTTGGLFGSSQATQPTTGGSGLFGSTTTAQPTTGGLFGNTQTQAPATGGLFGNTQTAQPAAGTGGLFGSTQTTQPTATGGLFGSTSSGGSLFGAPKPGGLVPAATVPALNTSTTPTTSGGLFGQSTTNLFGQSQAKPLFGASTTQPQPQQPALGVSTLSTSALRTTAPAQTQADAQTQFARLNARVEAIVNAWNPASPQCRFQHVFYNRVNPQQINLYGRPANMSEALWTKAVRDNPDPSSLVPNVALGFDDLRQRLDGQTAQATDHVAKLNELKTRIADLATHQSANHTRASRLAATHVQLYHRVLLLAAHLHLLIPAVRGGAVRIEEEAMRGVLEEIRTDVGGHGHSSNGRTTSNAAGRLRSKIAELWAVVGALAAARDAASSGQQNGEWKVVDEDGLAQIAQILAEQQAGLVHLTKILQKDLKDIAVVLGKNINRDDDGEDGADIWRSMRASVR